MNEFELITRFTRAFDVEPTPLGPGDDAAVLPANTLRSVVTTDALVEGVHFTQRAFSFADIGHKALAVNLSDLAAMGATPAWFVCSLGVPRTFKVRQLDALARGMSTLAKRHHVKLVGGNFTRSQAWAITITATGTLERAPLLRSGAQPGDVLVVSGPLGAAAAGFDALKRKRPPATLAQAQRRPEPHVEWGQVASAFASAAIDVSDGLAQDLGHLCRASNVGAEVESRALPLSRTLLAWAGPTKALEYALYGGEDYVLLVTVAPRHVSHFMRTLHRKGLGARCIGTVTAGPPRVVVDAHPLKKRTGFMHFE